MPTVVLYCWCPMTVHQFFCILNYSEIIIVLENCMNIEIIIVPGIIVMQLVESLISWEVTDGQGSECH